MLYSPPRTHRNAPTAMARTNRNTASLTSLRAAHRPMSTRTATGTALKTAGVFARVGGCSIIPPIRDLVQTLGTSGAGTYHRLVPDRLGCKPHPDREWAGQRPDHSEAQARMRSLVATSGQLEVCILRLSITSSHAPLRSRQYLKALPRMRQSSNLSRSRTGWSGIRTTGHSRAP